MRITIDIPIETEPLVHATSAIGAASEGETDGGAAPGATATGFEESVEELSAVDGGAAGGAVMAIEGLDDADAGEDPGGHG